MKASKEIDTALFADAKAAYESACTSGTVGLSAGQWYRLAIRLETVAMQLPVNKAGCAMAQSLNDRTSDCRARATRIEAQQAHLNGVHS